MYKLAFEKQMSCLILLHTQLALIWGRTGIRKGRCLTYDFFTLANVTFEFHYHVLEGCRVQRRPVSPSSHLLVRYDGLWEIFPSAYSQRLVSSHPVHSTTFSPAKKLRHVLFDLLTSISRSILKMKQSYGQSLIELLSCENMMHPDDFHFMLISASGCFIA